MRAFHVTAMEWLKQMSRQRAYEDETSAEGDGIPRIAKIECPDVQHEHVTDDDVEGSPFDVDERGREPFTGRMREWALKRAAHRPRDEMRDRVTEKYPSEEI